MNARSYPSADIGSDHQLVLSDLRIKFHTIRKANYAKQCDVSRLKNPNTQRNYEIIIGGVLLLS